jgi:hypothetical protein
MDIVPFYFPVVSSLGGKFAGLFEFSDIRESFVISPVAAD